MNKNRIVCFCAEMLVRIFLYFWCYEIKLQNLHTEQKTGCIHNLHFHVLSGQWIKEMDLSLAPSLALIKLQHLPTSSSPICKKPVGMFAIWN